MLAVPEQSTCAYCGYRPSLDVSISSPGSIGSLQWEQVPSYFASKPSWMFFTFLCSDVISDTDHSSEESSSDKALARLLRGPSKNPHAVPFAGCPGCIPGLKASGDGYFFFLDSFFASLVSPCTWLGLSVLLAQLLRSLHGACNGQAAGAALLAVRRYSPARVLMPAKDGHSAHGLLYIAAVLGDSHHLIRRLCHAHLLPAHFIADRPRCCSLVRSRRRR